MDKATLNRLRHLAGNEPAPKKVEDQSRRNMYEIRDVLAEASKPDYIDLDGDGDKKEPMKKAAKDKEKAKKVDEGKPEVQKPRTDAKALVRSAEKLQTDLEDKNKKKESTSTCESDQKPDFLDKDGDGDKKEPMTKAIKDKEKKKKSKKTETEQMREWSNSVYKQYDDRGHYQEQPDGETVDLSLRRYLNATPMKVKVEENIKSSDMITKYRSFKNE